MSYVVVEIVGDCEGYEGKNCVGCVYGPFDTKEEARTVKEHIDPFFAPHVMTMQEFVQ